MPIKLKKTSSTSVVTGNSVLFNGTNQYLSVANNAAFNFGTGSFTIEWWQYLNSGFAGTTGFPMGQKTSDATNGWQIYRNTSVNTDKISVRFGGTDYVTTVIPSSQVWEHWALVRDNSSTLTWYRNGTACGIYSSVTSNISDSGNMNIGYAQTWGYTAASSSISNLRILKGTALYTSSFSVPTTPLTAITSCSLLTCNDQTIRDASVNNFTITNNNTATVSTVTPFTASLASSMKFKKTTNAGALGNSVLFNGSNQYLTLPNTSSLNLGSNNFTIEAFVYISNVSGNKNIFYINGNNSSYSAICLYVQDSRFAFLANQTGGYPWTLQIGAVGPTISSNTWYHVATTRSGNSFYVFVNGTLVSGAPYSLSGALYNGTTNIIGYQPTVPSYFNGYISNARIINGTALYTASFSAPINPLTAIANTSLLTCNAATIVDSSTNNFTITNNGTATVSSAVTPFLSTPGTFKVKKSAGVYMIATGGDLITTSGSYKVHTFTTVGTSSFVVSSLGSTPVIECLLVGGGGGGGGRAMAGGGGGGGVVYTSSLLLATGSFSTIVGAGGIAATGMQASSGQNGGNTLFTYNSITTTVLGGGGGATEGYVGLNGANGGGGTNNNGAGGSSTGGGFPGGSGSAENYLTRGCGGGGGGAGGAGVRGMQGVGGNGGVGAIYNITGSAYYGGGGGGGGNTNAGGATAGAGGLGGGGLGGRTSPGTAGTTNTGGGGGGGGYAGTTGATETNGGNGGSGIILIKYRYTD